jgi:RNA polymerase sigma-70 factor, ECF subfamily
MTWSKPESISGTLTSTLYGESSVSLLERARAGDETALDVLFARYLPLLNRWATGRLPRWARDLADTRDLVQDALVETLRDLDRFDPRGPGAIGAHVRQAILDRIREEVRRVGRRPPHEDIDRRHRDEIDHRHGDDVVSPFEAAIGRQNAERYERALAQLSPEQQEAIIVRLESGCDYGELAVILGKPTAGAARLAARRALLKLAELMKTTA